MRPLSFAEDNVKRSPLYDHMQNRRLQDTAQAVLSGMPILNNPHAPGGLYIAMGQLIRGGKPWDKLPDPLTQPKLFADWARGWVRFPLVWEGED